MIDNENNSQQLNLDSFARAREKMIATNDRSYHEHNGWDSWRARVDKIREYTPEEIHRIISSGSLPDQQKLSRNYFYKDGYYKQIIIYYATLLKYSGVLIPSVLNGKSLSAQYVQKAYYRALDYVERMKLPTFLTNCAQRALIDGSYYGAIVQMDKDVFSVLDLPSGYCQSRFKDIYGNDIVEFDVTYFDTIGDTGAREIALSTYPKCISKAYKDYHHGKNNSRKWCMLPKEVGICFPFFDGRPLLLSVIPATIDYDNALSLERERDLEDIRKIIVQKIPHLTDGRLVFEPDEAAEIHDGTVGMLKGNSNVSVLTTYADVDAISSSTSKEAVADSLTRTERNIFAQAGVSGEIFTSTNSATLATSLQNDLALMMYLANKFATFITNSINQVYGNSNLVFKYNILPVSYYNVNQYVTDAFKLSASGYSFLLPAIALGLDQKDLVSIKDLENDVLKLNEKLKPLQSSYTQSSATDSEENGRPAKEDGEKSDKTVKNEESSEETGGL